MFSAFKRLVSAKQPPAPAPAPASAWKRQGNDALARGDLPAAAAHYLQGTVPPPGDPLAWLNLGYVQLELGKRPEARESLLKAQELLPRDDAAMPDVWCLLGRERQEERDWPAARDFFVQVVDFQPSHELAWCELGRAHEKLGDSKEAADCLHRAIALRGDFAEAIADLSQLELQAERYDEALRLADRLLALHPDRAQYRFARARALWKLERHDEALVEMDLGLLAGADVSAVYYKAVMLAEKQRHEEALASFDRVLEMAPDFADALANSAPVLRKLGRLDEGMARTDQALALQPGHPSAMLYKAIWLHDNARHPEAIAMIDSAVALHGDNAELALNRSYSRLLLGQLEEGWKDYERRWEVRFEGRINKHPNYGVPPWRGEPLEGRSIFLFTEQGLGDTIQFMRYVPLLARMAEHVYLDLQAPLVPLASEFPANCRLMKKGEAVPRLDFSCSLLSLPGAMGTTLETIPAAVPYISVEPSLVEKWRQRLGPKRGVRVGLVWSGNASYTADQFRSIPLEMLRAAAPRDVEFVSLQKEIRESDLAAIAAWDGFVGTGDGQSSFADAAAIACLVDVVITVDTSVGHMTGALGRPWWVMLAHTADWRWMLEREDSPWYPSVRLFRQSVQGQWAPVIDRVMAEVALLPRNGAPE